MFYTETQKVRNCATDYLFGKTECLKKATSKGTFICLTLHRKLYIKNRVGFTVASDTNSP